MCIPRPAQETKHKHEGKAWIRWRTQDELMSRARLEKRKGIVSQRVPSSSVTVWTTRRWLTSSREDDVVLIGSCSRQARWDPTTRDHGALHDCIGDRQTENARDHSGRQGTAPMVVLFAEGDRSRVQVAEAMRRRGGGNSALALSSLEASEGGKDELSSSVGRFKTRSLGKRTCSRLRSGV
jgi:hypothetical protein